MFRQLRRGQLVLDIVLGGALFLLDGVFSAPIAYRTNLFDGSSNEPSVAAFLIALLTGALFATAVVFRRLSPPLALTIAWVAAIIFVATARYLPFFEAIAVLMVLYATAAYGSKRTMRAGLLSAAVGGLIVTVFVFLITFGLREPVPEGGNEPVESGWFLHVPVSTVVPFLLTMLIASLALMGLAWALGLLKRTRMRAAEVAVQKEIAEALASAEAHRAQIARDMHDVVAHSLAVVIAQSDGARYAAAANPEAATEALRTIATTARGALGDVRLLLTQLRHSQAEGPQPTLADLDALYEQVRQAGADLEVDIDPAPQTEPAGAVQLAVFRILQEALTNALRHGDGQIRLHLGWHSDHVELRVRNRIPHTESASAQPSAHQAQTTGYGLIGMRERAQLVAGSIEIERGQDTFEVRGMIPINESAGEQD